MSGPRIRAYNAITHGRLVATLATSSHNGKQSSSERGIDR